MSDVKRYRWHDDGMWCFQPGEVRTTAQWVKAADYDTLVIDCNTLRAANEGLRETNRKQREERDIAINFCAQYRLQRDDAIASKEALVAALDEALEYLDDNADVVDGDCGEPAPNKAMLVAQSIRAALKAAKGEA